MESRTKNTKRNITAGLIKQSLSIVLPFIIRTIIIYTLGELYQGLNGLFTSVLQMLSLADLGFSTVVIYILYKPIADNDSDQICAIIAFLRKIYKIVGIVVIIIGLAIMPFLSKIIHGDCPGDINIYVLYLLYLANSTVSYFFFAYKSALLNALQQESIVSNIYSAVSVCVKLIQIVILLVFRNYYLFVTITILGSIINNIAVQIVSNRLYPNYQPRGIISTDLKEVFVKQIKGIMINRIADTARNSFDNIILSALLGLSVVAAYDNYYYIFSAIYGVSLVVSHAMQASVGNSLVTETVEKNYSDLRKFTFIYTWFTGLCTICLVCLYQPFMSIWMKEKPSLILPNGVMVLFAIYFFAITMNNIRNLYANGNGLFWEMRTWYVVEAVANLILNVSLGILFGISGILWATIITILLFNFFARTRILFDKYFKSSPISYYWQYGKYFITTCIGALLSYCCCNFINDHGIISFFIKVILCMIVPNLFYFLVYHRDKEFKDSIGFIRRIILRK
ncbi:MAG: hypothetical protein E7295_03245 [Lachnospiraceae bacterium]|nr:hypothetical protein [Lachnospiraceae bacterium]